MVGLHPALFTLERKGRETYCTDQDNEVTVTLTRTNSESPMLIGREEISNLARHKEEYNTAPKIDQSQSAYKREYIIRNIMLA